MKKHSPAANHRASRKPLFYVCIGAACLGLLVFFSRQEGRPEAAGGGGETQGRTVAVSGADDDGLVRTLVREEETYLALAPKMKALSESMMDLRLPGPRASSVFAPTVVLRDLGAFPKTTLTGQDMIEPQAWPVSDETTETTEVDLWRSLLDNVSYFEHAKLFIAAGKHPKENPYQYEARGHFTALAKMKSGEWRALKGSMDLWWARPEA